MKRREFSLIIPFMTRMEPYTHICDLTVTGTAEYMPGEEPGSQYDFEIEKVTYGGRDVTPVIEAISGSVYESELIFRAVREHMKYLFAEPARELSHDDLKQDAAA